MSFSPIVDSEFLFSSPLAVSKQQKREVGGWKEKIISVTIPTGHAFLFLFLFFFRRDPEIPAFSSDVNVSS